MSRQEVGDPPYKGRHAGERAYVLGNGPSRVGFEPGEGVVIACNAAYRDLERIDYLCVTDSLMCEEVLLAEWPGTVVSRKEPMGTKLRKRPGKAPDTTFVLLDKRPTLNTTGAFAAWWACFLGCAPIELVGFDGGLDNIYHRTRNYGSGGSPDWKKVQTSFQKISEIFPQAEFIVRGESFLEESDRCRLRPGGE